MELTNKKIKNTKIINDTEIVELSDKNIEQVSSGQFTQCLAYGSNDTHHTDCGLNRYGRDSKTLKSEAPYELVLD